MKKLIILSLFVLINIHTKAQTAINFDKEHTWQEIVGKAKREHKYIFIDCYATWCQPCKTMDKDIYSLKDVGEFYNKEFISIKLQFDSTKKDNESIKRYYYLAKLFATNYSINSFPTLLFFDPDIRAVHKTVGSVDKEKFISIARDAKNPEKQYYTLLKNYQSGKLDKTELLGLINVFKYVDKDFAGKMAVDFLDRMPDSVLGRHRDIMSFFASDPQIVRKAIVFINTLDKKDFVAPDNLSFIANFKKSPEARSILFSYLKQQSKVDINKKEILFLCANFFDDPQIHQWVINYLTRLSHQEIKLNVAWFGQFKNDPTITKIAVEYINALSVPEMFEDNNINLLKWFTDSTSDRGFAFFYKQGNKVDEIMHQKNFAESIVDDIIKRNAIDPIIKDAEEKEIEPDFSALKKSLDNLYSENIIERIVFIAKGDFYSYMIKKKKKDAYWSKFLSWRIENGKKLGFDTIILAKKSTSGVFNINNIVYNEFFFHCVSVQQLNVVAIWQKNLVNLNPENDGVMDTYACILYKAGRSREALEFEQKALRIVTEHNNKASIDLYSKTITKMKRGEKIWLQKEYIDG